MNSVSFFDLKIKNGVIVVLIYYFGFYGLTIDIFGEVWYNGSIVV